MMIEQQLILKKRKIQFVKNGLKSLRGIEVLELYEDDENTELNTMYKAYLPTYLIENGNLPYSKLPFSSAKPEIYAWILQNMEITEQKEYFLHNGVWVKIRILDASLAVESLWKQNKQSGFLLVESDYSRILEVCADSRDEENYLLDIWEYQR